MSKDVNRDQLFQEYSNKHDLAKEAIAVIYLQCYDLMLKEAFSLLQNRDDAEDAVHVQFVEFLERRTDLRINNFRDFAFISIRNRCVDILRKRTVQRERNEEYLKVEYPHQVEPLELPSVLSIEEKETQEVIHDQTAEALNCLAPRYRRAVELYYFKDKSRNEVAKEMNISPFTVRNLLVRALSVLKKNIDISPSE